MTEYL